MNLPISSNPVVSLTSVQQACAEIEKRRRFRPRLAIILGSGLGGLATDVKDSSTIPFKDIPGFSPTSAAGHAGNLILGTLASVPVAVLQGRSHRYEGHSTDRVVFPVRCLSALGATTLITTNAAGGLNPLFERGNIMAIDAHIDWLWNRSQWLFEVARDRVQDAFVAAGQVLRGASTYSPELIQRVMRISLAHQYALQRGTYISTLGPTYETRAEYRMFRWMGADAVGMSTTAEVLAAQQLGMKVLALSVITNVASTVLPQTTTHAEVVDVSSRAEPFLKLIIHDLLRELGEKTSAE